MADKSPILYPSRSVLELESEPREAITLILTLGSHSRFRVTGTRQVNMRDEVQTLTQRQPDPVPTNLHVALAPKPMRVYPAALTLLDDLSALGNERERRHSQDQAQTREPTFRTAALIVVHFYR